MAAQETPGGAPPQQPGGLRLTFAAETAEVRRVISVVRHWLSERGISRADHGTIEIVLAEALNNILEHAYGDGPDQRRPVTLTLGLQGTALIVTLDDRGRAIPGAVPPTAKARPEPGDLPEGGFGWHLIDDLSQSICYAREDGCNRLCLRLALRRDPGTGAL